jgi:hypothetical protein
MRPFKLRCISRVLRTKPNRALGALALVLASGCHSIGPGTVPRDRFEYSSSISESWKRQTLLNIIKLRYLDLPTFVDVGQIVSGYTLETALTLGGNLSSAGAVQGNSITGGGSARYTDRPTITYTPLTGSKFIRALMTPLPADSLLYMVQSGWPAGAVFFAGVAAMNGLKNQDTTISAPGKNSRQRRGRLAHSTRRSKTADHHPHLSVRANHG